MFFGNCLGVAMTPATTFFSTHVTSTCNDQPENRRLEQLTEHTSSATPCFPALAFAPKTS